MMAEYLIEAGYAYVDDQTPEEMAKNRGSFSEPGKNSPFRDRPVAESLDLFRRMKAGEFPGRFPGPASQNRHGFP